MTAFWWALPVGLIGVGWWLVWLFRLQFDGWRVRRNRGRYRANGQVSVVVNVEQSVELFISPRTGEMYGPGERFVPSDDVDVAPVARKKP